MDRVVIREEPAVSPDVGGGFEQSYAELGALFGSQPDEALPLAPDDLTRPHGLVLVIRRGEVGPAVGCGALKLIDGGIAEIKRMWIAPEVRGRGLGGRLLDALGSAAIAVGCARPRLDSNGRLSAAVAMYRARGYKEVAPFNREPFATHWMEKRLR